MDSYRLLKMLAVCLIAIVAVGEIAAYVYNPYDFDIECEWGTDEVGYDVYSSGSDVYDAVLLDGSRPLTDAFIYVDYENPFYDTGEESSDPTSVDAQYYAEQISAYSAVHGFHATTIGGSNELASFIANTLSSPYGHAIVSVSFALPSDVYSGNPDDPILEWIANGGSLYWMASEIGASYIDDGTVYDVQDGQTLFLGSECQNTTIDSGDATVAGSGFREALSLKTSDPLFGIDTSRSGHCLSLAYLTEGISSITMMGLGAGNVCIIGGTMDIDQLDDIGQLLTSGIDHDTSIAHHERGHVDHEHTEGTIAITTSDQTLFIYIGGIYTMYGRLFVQ